MSGFLVMAKRCDVCLFSASRIVSDKRARAILKECAAKDSHFVCHKATIVGKEACCRGFYDTATTNLIRIAGRLGAIEFVTEAELKERA